MGCHCFPLTPVLAQRLGSIAEIHNRATGIIVEMPAEESAGASSPESQSSGLSRHIQLPCAPGRHA